MQFQLNVFIAKMCLRGVLIFWKWTKYYYVDAHLIKFLVHQLKDKNALCLCFVYFQTKVCNQNTVVWYFCASCTTRINMKFFNELANWYGTSSLFCRPLVLDTVSVSDTFKMYLYRHIDTFFMENVSVYQYILCCWYFFWYYFTPIWPKY